MVISEDYTEPKKHYIDSLPLSKYEPGRCENDRRTDCEDSGILQKFHDHLSVAFFKLGVTIADNPVIFILTPLLICLLGATGFQRMNLLVDLDVIFYPSDGPAISERSEIEHTFPLNTSSHFRAAYLTRSRGYARVLIVPKDKGSIFRKFLWDEILQVDYLVRNLTISYRRNVYKFENMCAIRKRKCVPNRVLELYDEMELIERGESKIYYPVTVSPLLVPMYFGGIILDEEELFIESAKVLSLAYFLKTDTEDDRERDLIWEKEFVPAMKKHKFKYLNMFCSAGISYHDETAKSHEMILPFAPIVVVIMVLFSVGNTMMLDWVRSKIYMGLIGLLSAGISVGGAFGLLMYLGVPNAAINYVSPFLILGIGLDDMLVTLAAWRKTSIQDSVRNRLGQTYSDAGISVLITSLTTVVSLLIGATTPLLILRIFCVYSAVSVLVMYFVHMTFFGGFLAIFGNLEREQRHAISFKKIKAKSETETEKGCYSFWCTGGINPNDSCNPKDNKTCIIDVLLRDYFGKMLTKYYTKCIVIMLFLIYICLSIYGILNITEGYEKRMTVEINSNQYNFSIVEDEHFRQYPYTIQVMIRGDISYSNRKIQEDILDLHKTFESLPYVQPELTLSWMPNFFRRVRRNIHSKNFSDEKIFIKELIEIIQYSEDSLHYADVAFNEDYTRIVASRFFFQTKDIRDSGADTRMMNELREIAYKSPLNVTVFNPNFFLFDHGNFVKPAMIQGASIASFSMILISFVLIPSKWCSFYVGLSLVSIELGVLGFMTLWNVNLSLISMLCVFVGIGFSVDFTAHITYAFSISKEETPDEKIMDSLYRLGLPILQSGLSTICSIIVFAFVPVDVFIVFLKVVFLVILFAALHGLVLIPVLLSIAGPDKINEWISNFRKKN